MTKTKTVNFTKMDLAELQETHSEMQATAIDLGMTLGAEVAGGFTNETDGRNICEALDNAIRSFRAGLEKTDEDIRTGAQAPAASPSRATGKSSRAAGTKKGKSSGDPTTQESKVAKKTVKKAKTAAKKPTKKVAKKAVKKTGVTRADVIYEITAKGKKANPYRPDTERGKMFDKLVKHDSLAAFKKAGGEAWVLRIAERDGYAKRHATKKV